MVVSSANDGRLTNVFLLSRDALSLKVCDAVFVMSVSSECSQKFLMAGDIFKSFEFKAAKRKGRRSQERRRGGRGGRGGKWAPVCVRNKHWIRNCDVYPSVFNHKLNLLTWQISYIRLSLLFSFPLFLFLNAFVNGREYPKRISFHNKTASLSSIILHQLSTKELRLCEPSWLENFSLALSVLYLLCLLSSSAFLFPREEVANAKLKTFQNQLPPQTWTVLKLLNWANRTAALNFLFTFL